MSPASSGSLEVERYIGACLMKNASPNNQIYPGYSNFTYRTRKCNGWAGGMPLISFAHNQRRAPKDAESNNRCSSPRTNEDLQLSRLAVHTQGLPLILSRNHSNRKIKTRNNVQPNTSKKLSDKDSIVDTLSVASDESSSSHNSEASLPRIIKPRKRRKKDRKPRAEIPENSNIVTLKPYGPYCYERYIPKNILNPDNNNNSDPKKCIDETPQLLHRFEDLPDDPDLRSEPTACQCRYCDPSSQIWDIDKHFYSPFLTSSPFRQLCHSVSDPTGDAKHLLSEKISSALQTKCLISSFSLEDVKEKIPNKLEISTKIVTTPNGHRDLEIRLFSSFPIDDDRPEVRTKNEDRTEVCVKDKCESLTPEE